MKHFLLLLLAVAGIYCPALANATAPTDTLPGYAQLVHKVSASMCSQLSSSKASAIDEMAEPEVLLYVQALITKAMLSDSTALLTMMQLAQERGLKPQQVGNLLGQDAMRELSNSCPASLPLIARIGLSKQAQELAAANQPKLAAADRAALQPIATSICTKITATYSEKAFANLTPAQREAQFTTLFRKQLAMNRPQLLKRYTAAQLADEQQMRGIGEKVAHLMLEQLSCSPYIMQIGVDDINRQRAAKP